MPGRHPAHPESRMPATVQSSADGIIKARSVRHVDPIIQGLATSLAAVLELQYVKIFPERVAASNVLSSDGKKNPVVKVGAEGIVGVELLVDTKAKVVHFFALTSAVKGCGRRMVEAVVAATPEDWCVVVLFDWSGGFWERMAEGAAAAHGGLSLNSVPSALTWKAGPPRYTSSCASRGLRSPAGSGQGAAPEARLRRWGGRHPDTLYKGIVEDRFGSIADYPRVQMAPGVMSVGSTPYRRVSAGLEPFSPRRFARSQ